MVKGNHPALDYEALCVQDGEWVKTHTYTLAHTHNSWKDRNTTAVTSLSLIKN